MLASRVCSLQAMLPNTDYIYSTFLYVYMYPFIFNVFQIHLSTKLSTKEVSCKPYLSNPPDIINTSLTIQFLEFTYTNDRYPEDKITAKLNKYQPLLDNIQARGWKVAPLIVISAGVRGTTHVPAITQLKTTYKFSETLIKSTLTNINTIAIQHLTSIILHKRRLENNQPLPESN
jgi:hypothetical protein